MIDMQASDDQQQIIDAVARYLAENLPVARHRRQVLGGALPPGMLAEIAGLGWIGLSIREEDGGHGLGLIDDLLVCRELGRQLAPMGLLAAILGARLAAHAGRRDIVAALVTGSTSVGLVLSCAAPDATAAPATLTVVDGAGVSWLAGFTPALACLMPTHDAARLDTLQAADQSIDLERRAPCAAADSIAAGGVARCEGLLLGAAYLVGMAEATRDLAVAYAKEREQFGQPIGAFQAIKHFCADMALRAESAKCLLFYAGISLDKQGVAAAPQATAAKVIAADACLLNAAANIQVHGGTGFTDENDAHLYLKRAHVLERLLGTQRAAQSALGDSSFFRLQF